MKHPAASRNSSWEKAQDAALTKFDKAVRGLIAIGYDRDGIRELVDHAWAKEMEGEGLR